MTSRDGTSEVTRWSEETAFPLIAAFKERYPAGSDRDLMTYMHTNAPSTARHWRLRFEAQQRIAANNS